MLYAVCSDGSMPYASPLSPGTLCCPCLMRPFISRDFMLSPLIFRSFKVYHIREVCKETLENVPQFVGLFNNF